MPASDEAFRGRLLAMFRAEADEHVRALSSGLVALEGGPADAADILEAVFREAHSLKGAARAVAMGEIESVCQALENVLAAMTRGELPAKPELFDVLHRGVDSLGQTLSAGGTESAPDASRRAALVQELADVLRGARGSGPPAGAAPPPEPPGGRAPDDRPPAADTVRIRAARLDDLMRQAEELLSAKLAARERAAEAREILAGARAWRRRADGAAPASQDHAQALEGRLAALARALERDAHAVGRMVDDLVDDTKQALLLPVASALEVFPKLVRDLSREKGKAVDLRVHGAEIEMDRQILEAIKDPLIHLVRNGIDHGIETPEARRRRGKPERGTVSVVVTQQDGGHAELLVADDGAGMDAAGLRAAAVRAGRIAAGAAEALGEPEALALAFHSGVTTRPVITDISGRGLGLAIVREKVEALGGTVTLESRPGEGTTFRLRLPMTRATFRGVLVRVRDQRFVLPAAHVQRVTRVTPDEIRTVENRPAVQWNGKAVALVRLDDVLGLARPRDADGAARLPLVVLGSSARCMAFQVDEVIGEQEVLLKALGRPLAGLRHVAGATALGSGTVVTVLHVPSLLQAAAGAAAPPAAADAGAPEAAPPKAILVVEDSITARTLLRSLLEAAGYRVKTAVDGAEAWATLRTEAFDLVVSDVDMPRMNGFDLTAKIRGEPRLAALPVVLVTALESPTDRERGIDVGASAYLVKSGFDQGNLLDAIRRLT